MDTGTASIISAIVGCSGGILIAHLRYKTEIRKLKEEQVTRTVIENDFNVFIMWLNYVEKISKSKNTKELSKYNHDPKLPGCVALLDIRFYRGWSDKVNAIEEELQAHKLSNTLISHGLKLMIVKLRTEVMWFFAKQRSCLHSGLIHHFFWGVKFGTLVKK